MKKLTFRKIVAIDLIIILLYSVVMPGRIYAENPPSPDFSGFESSSTRDMVSEFTGDFTYNLPVIEIPGPDGSGYALSLSYHSGTSPDEDASWVGYGFTLNAGAINRSVRGLPDDYKNELVTIYNKTPMNWTATANVSVGVEVFSLDLGFTGSLGVRYNNYNGFGYNVGAGISFNKGVASLGYNVSDGQGSFSLSVNPAEYLTKIKSEDKGLIRQLKAVKDNSKISLIGSNYGLISYSEASRPFSVHPYTGTAWNFSIGVNIDPGPAPVGFSLGSVGSFSKQINDDKADHAGYGLFYSSDASGDNVLMDYSLEKETPYNKRDVYLGIPFNNADNYVVSGEGIGGSFRMYHKLIGQFKPNKVESTTTIFNIGGEIDAGLDFGAGLDLGLGIQKLKVDAWDNSLSTFSGLGNDADEPVFFRFTNDLGGLWEHASGDEPIAASMTGGDGLPGLKKYSLDISKITSEMNSGKRSGRSSYIDYNLNSTFGVFAKKPYLYTQESIPGMDRSVAPNGIGEFAITNENGQRYVYGLPVYNRNESNFKYGVVGASASDIVNNYLVYYKNTKVQVGEERNTPYASAYLLTAIYTPDYIDRTLDGPTDDDLGGYTKFNYVKKYGDRSSTGKFFKWRTPYKGLLYDRGSLSDQMDDVGSVSQGEKELYYLQSIETKSHVAIFTTSSRRDGLDADFGSVDPVADRDTKGANHQEKLDRIDLFSKKDVDYSNNNWVPKAGAKPIKTVRFQYDPTYPLCKNAPNSEAGYGKLTLQRVWFEYNGISPDKISPYEFHYEYPFSKPYFHYPAKYSNIENEYNHFARADQNPAYSSFNLDPWGYYQNDGATRFANMKTWVNQTPSADFDPAAWQLKVIKLPTGGEIHVQYEQDDYKYVQDRIAHVMISAQHDNGILEGQKIFSINPEEIGITSDNDKAQLAKVIENEYVNSGKKMYFKFLYRLLGLDPPTLNECNSDFITGYAFVEGVAYDANSKLIKITLGKGTDRKTLPHYTCKDFVLSQRAGKLIPFGSCDPDISGIQNPKPLTIVNELLGFAATLSFPGGVCQDLSNSSSYLRIPVLNAKKGGGLRVKRLLMYDNNMGNPVLYGNEYIYKLDDNSSSGVATNEPASNHEENILVDYIKRGDQNLFSKIVAGRDKKQTEGPIGESVLPGPSVGYSKVYVRNIHSGKTGTGFSVKEFYTAKDFPFQAKNTDINTHIDYMFCPLFLFNYMVNNVWATQGFSFIRNDMHGQKKRDASYSGILATDLSQSNAALVTEQAYDYFKPGEPLPVSTSYGSAVKYVNCGKEVDLTMANKTVKDINNDVNVEIDLTVGIMGIIPIPFFGAAPSYTRSEMELSSHATSKVINYPPIVKKATTFNEGSYHTIENIAFDEFTGKPVTTKSYDEFKGTYLIQNIPGSWEYKNLQQKAINEGKVFKNTFTYTRSGTDEYITSATIGCDLKNCMIPGDLIDIDNGNIYHIQQFDNVNSRFKIIKSQWSSIATDPNPNIKQLVILRSGRMNRLNEDIGSFTLHSTDENITLPKENASDRWIGDDNTFIKALNDNVKTLSGDGSFTLTDQYDHINIEPFISEVSQECAGNLRDASISNIEVLYQKTDYIQLKIISLEILCNGTWVKIEGKK